MRAVILALCLIGVPSWAVAKPFDLSTEWVRASLEAGAGSRNGFGGPTVALQFELAPFVGSLVPVYSVGTGASFGGGFGAYAEGAIGVRRILDRTRFGRPAVKLFVGGGFVGSPPGITVRGSVSHALFRLGPLGIDGALTARAMFSPGFSGQVMFSGAFELGVGF